MMQKHKKQTGESDFLIMLKKLVFLNTHVIHRLTYLTYFDFF
jgi:hypothetical protein